MPPFIVNVGKQFSTPHRLIRVRSCKKNSDYRLKKFKANTQPYYLVLNSNGDVLAGPYDYDLNIDNFKAFLDKGIDAYKK